MRVLFIGSTKRGYMTIEALIRNRQDVAGVISLRQDHREVEHFETQIRDLSERNGIRCYESKSMKDRDYADLISRDIRPDLALVVGCRTLIPKSIYATPPLGTLAVHDSLLPEYRGFAPLNWSILNGEDHTGVTLFYLSDRMDAGDVLARMRVPIGLDDTAPEVYERVCRATVEIVLETLPVLAAGRAVRRSQPDAGDTYSCSRNPEDGLIDWNRPTRSIYNQVRGLTYPYPGAYTYHQGKKLTIWKASPMTDPPAYVGRVPGRVVAVSDTEGYADVLTGDGVLRILQVQMEDGSITPAAATIRSVRDTVGMSVPELMDRLKALEKKVLRPKKSRAP